MSPLFYFIYSIEMIVKNKDMISLLITGNLLIELLSFH